MRLPSPRCSSPTTGRDWYALPYTGEPCDWVLGGEAGHKTLAVRFGAADGSVSPVVTASIDVDTAGPVTLARSVAPAGAGRTAFRFVVRDAGSPRVTASIVVRGNGIARRFALGSVRTGSRAGARQAAPACRQLPLARGGDRPRRVGAGAADGRHARHQVIGDIAADASRP